MISVFAVFILLTSGIGIVRANLTSGGAAAPLTSPAAPPASSFNPYSANLSAWPTPDTLPNVTGTLSLPRISSLTLGATFVYVLVFVEVVPSKGTILESDTGTYSPTLAGAIAVGNGCADNCTQHLPIAWNVPTPVAVYGGSPIQSDALAVDASDHVAYVAAASNNSTRVYASAALGAPESWYGLTYTGSHGEKQNGIAGGGPTLAVTPCQLVLTTHPLGETLVTGWANLCGGPPLQPPGSIVVGSGGGRLAQPAPQGPSTPQVYGVVPLQTSPGYPVDVYGTGFGSAQSVRFGTTSAQFQVLSATHLRATVPSGAGATNVQVMVGGSWSGTNCSTQFTYGAPLPLGTPQVSWVTPSAGAPGQRVTVYGYNLPSGGGAFFGTVYASLGRASANTLTGSVPVPAGSPTVNVTLKNGTRTSPSTCADVFHYLGPYLGSLSPAQGWPPLTVTLSGTNFSSSASVFFGPNASASVTHVSSTTLRATVPSGLGSVSVNVRQSGSTSNSLTFTYKPPTPVVSAILPNQGPPGSGVTVLGQYLNASSTVYFGSRPSSNVQHISTGKLIATAPSGSGIVNLTVHQFGKVSTAGCDDQFTYGPAYPSGIPYIAWLSSSQGVAGSTITVTGVNFSAGLDEVLFGGVASPYVNVSLSNSTSLTVTVPQGIGNVTVEVVSPLGASPPVCTDRFDIVSTGTPPSWYTDWNATMPASTDAVALLSPYGGGVRVVATISNQLAEYDLAKQYGVMQARFLGNVTTVGSSPGSAVFTQIGGTELSVPGGIPLEIAAAPDGFGSFVLVTADQNGRTVVETLVWNGINWSQPYFVTPSAGSARDPQLDPTPFGSFDATWVDSGGVSQIDFASFTASGSLLQSPAPLPGSGGASATPVGTASLVVDPMGHPMVAWSDGSGTPQTAITLSADYESPSATAARLQSGWSQVVPADFEAFGGSGRAQFIHRVSGSLNNTTLDIGNGRWCGAEQNVSNAIYTNLTWLDDPPAVWGNLTGCPVIVGSHHNTILSDTVGVMDADFYLSVETKWLMESLGVGRMLDPNWASTNPTVSANPGWFQPDTGGTSVDRSGDSVVIQPETLAVNTVVLNTVGTFPTRSAYHNSSCLSSVVTDRPFSNRIVAQVSVPGMNPTTANVTSPGYLASPAFTYLHGAINGTWSATIVVQFETLNQTTNSCTPEQSTATVVPTPAGWPRYFNATLGGSFTTGLDPFPAALAVRGVANPGSGPMEADTVQWQNTVNSTADLWVNGSAAQAHWHDGNFSQFDNASGGNLSAAPQNVTSMSLRLVANASAKLAWWPVVNASEVSYAGPGELFTESCSDQGAPAGRVWAGSSDGVTNLSSSALTLTWGASFNATGWVTLDELGSGGSNLTISAQVLRVRNGTFEYVAEAHGLALWGTYSVNYSVASSSACTTASGAVMGTVYTVHPLAGPIVQLPAAPLLFEQDAPYDSITHQGGGATVAWQVPFSFEIRSGTRFLNGSLSVTSSNSSIRPYVVPLTAPLTPFTNYSLFGTRVFNDTASTFAVNLTALSLDNWYTVTLVLNYSTSANPHFNATNSLSFWYERDTTGDGLTDWEKQYGWEVTSTNPWGGTTNTHVTANPYAFATNGLVGDYVEKEYGLNPATVDSAASHMLDTWNLTFNLKPGGGALPTGSNFEVWYENGSYNPFANSVYYSHGLNESQNRPVQQNLTNVSASAPYLTSGDGAPYAARVLWSYGALETFVSLPGVKNASWLRAVEGTWKGIPTLTVWGKLSGGANPLAASTPNDGIPDGSRVNPLYDVGLKFYSVYANQSNLATGTGYAVEIYDNSTSDGGAYRYLNNCSAPAWAGNASYPTVSNYVTTLPVTQTQRTQTVSLEVVANESSGLTAIPINGSQTEVSVSYDLVKATSVTVRVSGSGSGGRSTLFGVFQDVPMGTKAPTWLWVPTDNATVNGLPVGLQRYTGEQSFDLVVVNVSASATSDSIPLPWGGTASGITLSAGMNDFLVPREQFLYSPLGQAIFLGMNTSYNASNGAPPLIGSAEQSLLTGFGGANLMVDLGAYWQDRVIASGPGNITGSTETGTPTGNPLEVQVMAASSATSANTGGLTSDPGLYSTVGDPSALQSIITLNITSTATLDLLLAALLDNTTGGSNAVNGTLESVTYQVGFLGLNGAVVNAISNATEPNDGLYGAPASHFPPPPPPSGWGAFWNAATSFATNPLGTVLSLVDTVWNAAVAAFTYLNHLVHEAAAIGAEVVARTAAAIVHVGQIIANALEQFLVFLKDAIIALLQPVVAPIEQALSTYASGVSSPINQAWSEENSSGAVTASVIDQFWSEMSGSVFVLALGIGLVIEIALTIATPLDLGASFVIPILATLVSAGLASYPGMPQLTTFSATALGSLRTFLVGLDPVPGIFVNPELYQAFGALAIGTSGIAALLAYSMLKETIDSIPTNGAGAAAFAGILFAAAVLAFVLEAYGFFHDSPGLIILSIFLSLLGAGVAGVLVAKGASEIYGPSLADYLTAILLSGGFSAGFDVGKLVTE